MCITGMWNMNIPSVLLLDILSRLSLKVNIQASAVCKTWCGAAVSVRKLQPPHPWVFYPLRAAEEGNYLLFDPSRSQTYKLNFPELKNYGFSYSRDGWLLVVTKAPSRLIFLFNPFTRDHIYLPKLLLPTTAGDCCSAAPTSSANCLVISFNYTISPPDIVIDTWRPGETIYMDHTSINSQLPGRRAWNNCDFSNGMFYCFSTCGYLGVFDPSPNRETWKILPVKPCLAFRQVDLTRRMMITEHEGDIFVKSSVFKLNRKGKGTWEEKRELGGLTIFASRLASLTRASSLSSKERNKLYQLEVGARRLKKRCEYGSNSGYKARNKYSCRALIPGRVLFHC
ncbi:hypothetical protein YC2023_048620 [Brassica napus]